MFLDQGEVLGANLVHKGKLFENFGLSVDPFLFSDLEVGQYFLLGQDYAPARRRLRCLGGCVGLNLLKLLRGLDGGGSCQIVVIVATEGNAEKLTQIVLDF